RDLVDVLQLAVDGVDDAGLHQRGHHEHRRGEVDALQLVGAEEQQDGEEIEQQSHGRDYPRRAKTPAPAGTLAALEGSMNGRTFTCRQGKPDMTPQEQQAILTIALMAALADGDKADVERESLRGIAESLGGKGGVAGLAAVYQDVLLRRVDLAGTVARLGDAGQRELAYEMAVCVCDADGARSTAESAFLADLKARLKPDAAEVAAFERTESELVQAA